MTTLPPIDSLTLADAPRAQYGPKPKPRAEKVARRDAMKADVWEIPDPFEFAWSLPKPYCFWLSQEAWRSHDPANRGCWRVEAHRARDLFSMGLCDRDGYLTAFGNAVRKAMLEQGA